MKKLQGKLEKQQQSDKIVALRIPLSLFKKLQKCAKNQERDVSKQVRFFVHEGVKHQELGNT